MREMYRTAVAVSAVAFAQFASAQVGWSVGGHAAVPGDGLLSIYGDTSHLEPLRSVAREDGWIELDQGTTASGKKFVVLLPPPDWRKTERLWTEAGKLDVAIGPMRRSPDAH